MSGGTNDAILKLSLQERIQQGVEGYTGAQSRRQNVKTEIARAYSLQKANEFLTELLSDKRVVSNPVLKTMFKELSASTASKAQEILDTPTEILSTFENYLMKLVKYQIQHDERNLITVENDKKLTRWLGSQRENIRKYLEKKEKEKNTTTTENTTTTTTATTAAMERSSLAVETNIQVFRTLHVKWESNKRRHFDDYLAELREFKERNGHVKVRRLEQGTTLGEWVHKIRSEYHQLQRDPTRKVCHLNPERIAVLNEIGMIWKIRHGRPKKGDANFRLERTSEIYSKKKQQRSSGADGGGGGDMQDEEGSETGAPAAAGALPTTMDGNGSSATTTSTSSSRGEAGGADRPESPPPIREYL